MRTELREDFLDARHALRVRSTILALEGPIKGKLIFLSTILFINMFIFL